MFPLGGLAADLDVKTLGAAPVQPSVSYRLDVQFPRPLDQPRQDPISVPQQRRIGRPVDVRFHRGGVDAEFLAADEIFFCRMPAQKLVDLLPRLGPDRVLQLVERREVDLVTKQCLILPEGCA